MLAAARMVGALGTPLLGINLGKLGFLAEVSIDEIEPVLDEIARGDYLVEDRMVLTVRRDHDAETICALNEVVVDKGQSARVIELETFVNGEYLVTYSADGLIVTTPTGSTAYSLASGGPIVAPASKVVAINPVAPHTLTARPVVVPDDSVIRLVVAAEGRPVHLTADGQIERTVDTPAEFEIRKAGYTVKLVKRKQRTYFDLLRTKLLWGRDLRVRTHS
jgi:NAD+ kinase